MSKISWLDELAESLKSKNTKTVTASVKDKTVEAAIKTAKVLIIAKNKLPKAVEGNIVKYHGAKWTVANANYKDGIGDGIVIKRIAAIDEKSLTDAPTRAYTNPGDVYDYNVRETSEIPDFQEAAQATEEQVAVEDSVDRTTPKGRYTNPIVKQIVDSYIPEEQGEPAVHDVSDESAEIVEDTSAELPVTPVDEEVIVDENPESEDEMEIIEDEVDPEAQTEEVVPEVNVDNDFVIDEQDDDTIPKKDENKDKEEDKKEASASKFASNPILKSIMAAKKDK